MVTPAPGVCLWITPRQSRRSRRDLISRYRRRLRQTRAVTNLGQRPASRYTVGLVATPTDQNKPGTARGRAKKKGGRVHGPLLDIGKAR